MYALIENGAVKTYPYGLDVLRRDNPAVSFPGKASDELLAQWNVLPVKRTELPAYNPMTERIEEGAPEHDGQDWVQTWIVTPLTDAEKAERAKAGVPSQVAMRQARLALLYAGLLDDVQPAIDSIPDPISRRAAQIEWEYSSYVERDKPLVAGIAAAVGLSVEQVWDLLKFASTL